MRKEARGDKLTRRCQRNTMKFRKCTFITTKARIHSPPRILVLVFLASLSAPIAPIVSVNVEVDVRAVGEQNFLSTATSLLANQPTERELHTPLDVSKGKGLTADDYLWQNVITEIQGREYAVVYDEPDNLVRLDRSEISGGLVSIHPLEITGASADSFFADLAFVDFLNAENSANNESLRVFWFSKVVRGAAEIHVAPRGNVGRRVTALCSALIDLEARRKVLHLYAGAARGGGIDVCAGEEDGRDRCVSREEWDSSGGWRGWQVLRHPSGFSHLELAIDEPLAGDMLPACSAGNMLHRLVVSLNAFQAVPPNVTLDITIDGTVLLTAPLTPVISGHGEEAGAEGEGKRGRDSVREGEWDQVWCDLALGGKWEKRLEHLSGRCSFLLMLRPLQVGRHTAQAMLKSSVTLRNISVVTPFTVVGGVLEEQQGVQVAAKRLERTPVQEAKGLWVWKSIQVPELGQPHLNHAIALSKPPSEWGRLRRRGSGAC